MALPSPPYCADGLVGPCPAPVALKDARYRHHLGTEYRRHEDQAGRHRNREGHLSGRVQALPPRDRLGPPEIRGDERADPCEECERRQKQAEQKPTVEQAGDLVEDAPEGVTFVLSSSTDVGVDNTPRRTHRHAM